MSELDAALASIGLPPIRQAHPGPDESVDRIAIHLGIIGEPSQLIKGFVSELAVILDHYRPDWLYWRYAPELMQADGIWRITARLIVPLSPDVTPLPSMIIQGDRREEYHEPEDGDT